MLLKTSRIQKAIWLPILYVGVISNSALAQNSCDLSSSHLDQLVLFLTQQNDARTDPSCVEYAIDSLTQLRSVKAVPALIKFLDFPEPLSLDEEEGRMAVASGHRGVRYRAVDALFAIGEAATPSLIEVLRDPATSPIKYKNALTAYLNIHREERDKATKYLADIIASDFCPVFRNANDKELILFLEEHADKQKEEDTNCVGFAVLRLGITKSAIATKTLLRYLNYEWPLATLGEPAPNPDYPLLYSRQHFVAVTAVYLLGSPALPQLIRLLENSAASSIGKAIEIVMLIYAEYPPQGIAVINSVSAKTRKASPHDETELLASAVRWCDLKHRIKCEEVARHQRQLPK
jgi:PBS lyase HEAT-like repeat